MKPIDYRNETFEHLRCRLVGDRVTVLEQLRVHGPCSTRELAGLMSWDILNVRPRVTELVQLGFVECVDSIGREGCYRARPLEDAERIFEETKTATINPQLSLHL